MNGRMALVGVFLAASGVLTFTAVALQADEDVGAAPLELGASCPTLPPRPRRLVVALVRVHHNSRWTYRPRWFDHDTG